MAKYRTQLQNLKQTDVYSLILFALFKIKDTPEYSSLSELIYILDKDNLLKLCEYFGGTTLRIPTVDELENLVYSLVLYQFVDIDGMDYEEAVNVIGHKSADLHEVKSNYQALCEILSKYDFRRASEYEDK